MREDGLKSVLINPNIATIQTDTRFADRVYLLPVTPAYVESVVEKERPDGIMLAYGGQTALNCGVGLDESGALSRYGVRVLGTQIPGIKSTEDRQLFKDSMGEAGVPVLRSRTVTDFAGAREAAAELGYPVIVRVAYTLGGRGGGVAHNEIELHEIVGRGVKASMVGQVLVEEYVGGWKQIEYEVMRDGPGNSVVVCNMENVLSMKVHTGDNIVVAPSQTIDNSEYHMLRSAALKATSHVGIVGECNIQYALDSESDRYAAIEINPRLSRSSALASKATGYPLAYMSAKIGLGYGLPELANRITKSTTACFEPSLDYIVCKHPRWDFAKFELANRRLGPAMKSVGEVMAVGRTFEESLQKAIRMLGTGNDGLVLNRGGRKGLSEEELEDKLANPDDGILYHVAAAVAAGFETGRIHRLSAIDPWFIEKIARIVRRAGRLGEAGEGPMREAKRAGFSDAQIARARGISPAEARSERERLGVTPCVKQIDTLAAEWPAATNYLYVTYGGSSHDVEPAGGVAVLGAGPYRIGSSVEFDWGTVNMVWGLQENGEGPVTVVNCNPETVSTDYDVPSRLYFEELTEERILDIAGFEGSRGIVTCVGGQTANNLAPGLAAAGLRILGTSAADVDRAEDRSKFSAELDKLHIPQPPWQAFTDMAGARAFARRVGYPVIVRPSYVLSGAAMKVVWSEGELHGYVRGAAEVSPDRPVVISKFMLDSLEVDVDGVCNGREVSIGAVVEHIDSAGVHSGDAMMCIPPWRLDNRTVDTITDYARRIALTFNVRGPFNLQFLVHDSRVYVIELNIRASRSMPFVSKLARTNLISLAARAVLGRDLPAIPESRWRGTGTFGIKVPQFSFMQLDGADIALGVEMQSTGEAACFGGSFYDALAKGLAAVGYSMPRGGTALVTVGGESNREKLAPSIAALRSLGFEILATEHTAESIGGGARIVHKISEPGRKPNIADLLYGRKIDFIINIPATSTLEKYVGMLDDEYQIRRKALELGVPVLTTVELAESFVRTLQWLRGNSTTRDPLLPYLSEDAP
ncbi:MAG: carbamoyl-phosphate synthase (glutamine-hydrolyzing) large subunit [Nitrosopumilus sp.]|nr:carbamoyl-phosphate synthase (glutamine-hydrolyzing) large subunit [Nitrosopumilus sp.]MDA7941508.1 carbamoyl-phosphate synthase (glutamine-hydrolyzing) large subunit [Nitrosopumilus sp.]MDA7943350.1 carbamoyl-phosphate synthase (glutamine-hydrolyzing) large subunit [Nitrosopumilus sp.]MDA7944798.1 carbamoyl-phosphate synthase (glutamine-hydrolyzing) large subunit [Nitrosopumilus sp.]MDA7952942.1 carbamoyl-phosphate synthase (glutamine-hydrolyzing) large subunit [Nitrosopumilus sp.]